MWQMWKCDICDKHDKPNKCEVTSMTIEPGNTCDKYDKQVWPMWQNDKPSKCEVKSVTIESGDKCDKYDKYDNSDKYTSVTSVTNVTQSAFVFPTCHNLKRKHDLLQLTNLYSSSLNLRHFQ